MDCSKIFNKITNHILNTFDDDNKIVSLDWSNWNTYKIITVYNAYQNFIVSLVNDKEELAIFDDYGQTLTDCIKIENLEEWIIKNIILNHNPSNNPSKP